MADLKTTLTDIAKAIVDSPDEVTVVQTEDETGINLVLSVAPDDMGMVIGKHGKIAKAIRSTFEQTRIPQKEYLMPSPNTSAGSVVYYDIDFVQKLLQSFIYDDITPEQYIETNGIQKNNWYAQIR